MPALKDKSHGQRTTCQESSSRTKIISLEFDINWFLNFGVTLYIGSYRAVLMKQTKCSNIWTNWTVLEKSKEWLVAPSKFRISNVTIIMVSINRGILQNEAGVLLTWTGTRRRWCGRSRGRRRPSAAGRRAGCRTGRPPCRRWAEAQREKIHSSLETRGYVKVFKE